MKVTRTSTAVTKIVVVCLVCLVGICGQGITRSVTARSLHHITLWLDWYPNSDHAGIYVALARGYFAQEGLSVTAQVPSGAADALRLVAHGSGDVAISYEPDVLLARAKGVPVQAIGSIIQRPLNTLLTLASSGITRPRQLVGKTVGMAGAASDFTDLSAMLHADGATLGQTHTLIVNYSLLDALLHKKVDAIIGAYWTWEALQAAQMGHAVNAIHIEQWGVPAYDELVFASGTAEISQNPGVLRAFLRAVYHGYADATEDPAAAAHILLKAPGVLSMSEPLLEKSVRLLGPLFHDAQGHYGRMPSTAWQKYANWMLAGKMLKTPIRATDAETNNLLP